MSRLRHRTYDWAIIARATLWSRTMDDRSWATLVWTLAGHVPSSKMYIIIGDVTISLPLSRVHWRPACKISSSITIILYRRLLLTAFVRYFRNYCADRVTLTAPPTMTWNAERTRSLTGRSIPLVPIALKAVISVEMNNTKTIIVDLVPYILSPMLLLNPEEWGRSSLTPRFYSFQDKHQGPDKSS